MPAEFQGPGRLAELSSEGRERNSFLGRGTGLCKGPEVEGMGGWKAAGGRRQCEPGQAR